MMSRRDGELLTSSLRCTVARLVESYVHDWLLSLGRRNVAARLFPIGGKSVRRKLAEARKNRVATLSNLAHPDDVTTTYLPI